MCPYPSLYAWKDQSWQSEDRGQNVYAALNIFLNNAYQPDEFSEDDLAHWFQHIENNTSDHHPAHWLCLARLAEAALLTAAARADRADFRGATDLLANPRRINVHYLGTSRLVRKERHTPLSTQFAEPGRTPEETLSRLAKKTMLHTAEDALLPALYQRLKSLTFTGHTYLSSLGQRMERIADTLNFLACDGIFTPKTLQARLRHLPKDKRRWYTSQLCNFHTSWFWHLGESIFLCLEDSMAQGSSVKG
jgi:hypothetical protein